MLCGKPPTTHYKVHVTDDILFLPRRSVNLLTKPHPLQMKYDETYLALFPLIKPHPLLSRLLPLSQLMISELSRLYYISGTPAHVCVCVFNSVIKHCSIYLKLHFKLIKIFINSLVANCEYNNYNYYQYEFADYNDVIVRIRPPT